jgi:hypothetical protein
MSVQSYLLGNGVFSIGSTAIALTRGGGKLTIERTFKEITADGDFGPVEDRLRLDREVVKLQCNMLEILAANMPKMYPALEVDATTVAGTSTVTSTLEIVTGDYMAPVTWTGKLANGKTCKITLTKAINLENIEWSLVDKDEVVPQVTYTGVYAEASRTTPPWKIDFVNVV